MFMFDLLLGVSGALFLLTPLDMFALSLGNLSLLVLFIFLTAIYQIHLFRTYSGCVSFYMILPVNKYCFLILLLIDAAIPIVVLLLLSMITVTFSGATPILLFDNRPVVRLFDIVLIFFIIKTIALPMLALYKKNFLLIFIFVGAMAFLYGIFSIIAEVIHLNSFICGLLFMVSIQILNFKIVSNVKIN